MILTFKFKFEVMIINYNVLSKYEFQLMSLIKYFNYFEVPQCCN